MKKQLFLLIAALMAMGQNAFAYDFSAVSPSGHTLYYKIINSVNHYVKVTYPNDDQMSDDPYFASRPASMTYGNTPRPSGALVIPDTVSNNGITYTVRAIGSYAFCECPYITSVVMPNSVDSIGGCAFRNCTNLTSFTFSNTLRYIGNNSLSGCNLGDVVLPSSVRILKFGALRNSHIINITLNDSIERLEPCCLANNQFVSLFIPASVNYIDDPCESMVNLTSIVVDPNNPYYDSRDNCNAIIKKGENKLIQGCNGTTIPDGVVSFDVCPFYGCSFETLVMPNSVITMDCFRSCHINKLVISSPLIGCPGSGFDTIQFLCQTPPSVLASSLDRFNQVGIYGKPIIVPCGTLSAYHSAPVWSNCTNMMEYEAPQITLNAENGTATVFTYPSCTSDTAIVSAIADTNYHFVQWSDGSTQNPYTVVLNGNTTLTAIFAIDSVNVTASPADSLRGTVMGGGVVPLGGTTTLTAIPTGDNIFLCWSNGVHDNPYTLTVTSDTTLQAIFTLPDTIVVYDTVYVPVHDTTYVPVHDTTIEYINHYIHDTTFVNNYIHDTMIQFVNQYVHDTTFVNNYVHDTVRMTTQMFDTTIVNIYQFDTAIYNTYHFDTLIINNHYYDTVYITTHHYDTIYITQEGIGGVDAINAKVYSSRGQIVVEGADGNMVTLYDVTGRILATKQDNYLPLRFDAPASGTYMIKIGNYPARKVVVIR